MKVTASSPASRFALLIVTLLLNAVVQAAPVCRVRDLDFNSLKRGQYVTNALQRNFGVTVFAKGGEDGSGYTPNGAARVFDTATPGSEEDGDPDLGSPNEACPGGGPGIGAGGAPGSMYPNCVPLGNVLIVQETDKPTPDDNAGGGTMIFTFDPPADVKKVGMFFFAVPGHGKTRPIRVLVTDANGRQYRVLKALDAGENGVYYMPVNKNNVAKMEVVMHKSGAITSIDYENCMEPTIDSVHSSGAGGDPHLKRWNGAAYSYHGECDLVLIQNDKFNAGEGFDIHMRTTMSDMYSYIESVAMRIGNSVLEVNENTILIDGKEYNEETDLPKTLPEGYTVEEPYYIPGSVAKVLMVKLNDGDFVKFTMYKHFMNVDVSGLGKDFENSMGLLGTYHEGAMVGRDGKTIFTNNNSFGLEWQVQASDGLLFQNLRAPVYPQQCKMPSRSAQIASRRLLRGSNDEATKAAEAACAHKPTEEFSNCVFDVLATGDIGLAGAW